MYSEFAIQNPFSRLALARHLAAASSANSYTKTDAVSSSGPFFFLEDVIPPLFFSNNNN